MCKTKSVAFIGPAGVGKTHSLVNAVRDQVLTRPLERFQSVLALTFMHGARRRLYKRLASVLYSRARIECSTIDSFALALVKRYRRHLGISGLVFSENAETGWTVHDGEYHGSFAAIRESAARLVGVPAIQAALGQAYPIVVVDEFQDCRDGLLRFVQALARPCHCFFCADDFQCLDGDDNGEAVDWLRAACEIRLLDKQWRTRQSKLLKTAEALRSSVSMSGGIEVLTPDGPGLAAWEVAKRFEWKGWSYSRTVVLSPTGPVSSVFVRGFLSSIGKQLGQVKKLGPFPFDWISSAEAQVDALCEKLPSGVAAIPLESLAIYDHPLLAEAVRHVRHRCILSGKQALNPSDLRTAASSFIRNAMAFGFQGERQGKVAMTIKSAKNREFDNVVVLWPHEIVGDDLLKRKLLYNAVTRARHNGVILVQGGEKRLSSPELGLVSRRPTT